MFAQLSQTALDALSNPIAIKNTHGEVSICNNAFLGLLEAQKEHVIGRTVFEYLPHHEAEVHAAADLKLIAFGQREHTYQAEISRSSKKILDIYKTSFFSESNQIQGLLLIVVNHQIKRDSTPDLGLLLTAREKVILEHIAQGGSQKRIAMTLGISHYTVNDHLKSIYTKLGVRSRSEAQHFAATKMDK